MNQADASPKKIGIYGGTFDPIHLGHISLAFEIMEAHQLDEVWFCPTSINPLKKNQKNPVSPEHRLNMLRLAIEGQPRFRINEIELFQQGPSYTINTLRALVENSKNAINPHQFFLIIGDDSAQDFHKWREPEEIVSLATLLIGKRNPNTDHLNWPGSANLQEAFKKGMTPTRMIEISSSEIRERLSKKMFCGHLLQRKVLDYIILNDLYS